MRDWELSFGFYPGIMVGFRSYKEVKKTNHVLYIQAAREELEDRERSSLALAHSVNGSDYDDEEEI